MDYLYTNTCDIDSRTGKGTDQQITSSPNDISVTQANNDNEHQVTSPPNVLSITQPDNSTNHQVTSSPIGTQFALANSSKIKEVHESSSLPWLWIAVTVILVLLTVLLSMTNIILLITVRHKNTGLSQKKKQGNTLRVKGIYN